MKIKIDRRFFILFFISLSFVVTIGLLYIKLFYECKISQDLEQAQTYQEIDIIIPTQEFLKRGANSANLSMVKRVLVNQWIYFNEKELIKLIVYAQGAASFDELQKALNNAMKKESKNSAIGFVKGTLELINKNSKLMDHVSKSLKEGWSQDIHALRGALMQTDPDDYREYKKLKSDYRKAMYQWIDKKHGSLLDNIILQF